ncbi:hypothetical protein OsI_15226 [Oryza sativa Indica Group]|uniref:Pentatricopeptide repeat-containing protein n=1 Tax=Oryza sativa subsp. indica TaxID=39946 RepID=A2XRG5_ORYSI|nr:hypothetical protein OsI_15226 [Oryza sativa Indica Group]
MLRAVRTPWTATRSRSSTCAAASLPAHRGEPGIVGAAHAVGVRTGFAANVYFCNTLVDAYARRGMVARARKLFDEMPARDVVSWTSLVSGHAGVGDVREVSCLLSGMRVDGCEPSAVTLMVVLRACTSNEDVVGGGQLHYYAVKSGLSDNLLVLNSILMYLCRLPALDDAVALFKQSPRREAISWNIMISEYSSEGNISKVAEMYQRMRREEAASCGSVNLARRCFDSIHQKDIVAWSSIIEAYMIHGYGMEPWRLWQSGIVPQDARRRTHELFDCMTTMFGFTPELGHYTCMVDVLGRSGHLDDALQVISDMNVKARWENLGCSPCFMQDILEHNTQASSDRWDEVESIRSSMVEMDLQKLPAWTCVAETGCEIEVSIDGPCSQCTVLRNRSPRGRRCQWGLLVAGRVQLLARGSNRSDWMGCEYLALLAVKFSVLSDFRIYKFQVAYK